MYVCMYVCIKGNQKEVLCNKFAVVTYVVFY
jgi:hypothetical protein